MKGKLVKRLKELRKQLGLKTLTMATLATMIAATMTSPVLADDNTIALATNRWTSNTYVVKSNMELKDVEVAANSTVYLDIRKGATLTVTGTNAYAGSGRTGGGGAHAGIYLPSTSTLVVMGEGTLVAQGGHAGRGANGGSGSNAYESGDYIYSGASGAGGGGGGGAAAGIGGNGGNGGTGGSGVGGVNKKVATHNDDGYRNNTTSGGAGTKGGQGTNGYGKLIVLGKVTVKATGGNAGYGGSAGGKGAFKRNKKGAGATRHDREGFAAGGAGGGGGAGGTAAPGIGCGGTGGAGGGGGGGSAVYKNDDGDSSEGDLIGGGGTGGRACSGYNNGGATCYITKSGHGGAGGGSTAGAVSSYSAYNCTRDSLASVTITGQTTVGRCGITATTGLSNTARILNIDLVDAADNRGIYEAVSYGTTNIKDAAGAYDTRLARVYAGIGKTDTVINKDFVNGINISKPGYVLTGWYTTASGGDDTKVLNPDGTIYQDVADHTYNKRWNTSYAKLYAHWERAPRKITFDYQGGRVGTSTSSTMDVYPGEGLPRAGSDGSFTNVARKGYRLIGYSTEKGSKDPSKLVYETKAVNYKNYITDPDGKIQYIGEEFTKHLGEDLKLVNTDSWAIDSCPAGECRHDPGTDKQYIEKVEKTEKKYFKGYTSSENPLKYTSEFSGYTPEFKAAYPYTDMDLTLYAIWEPIEYNIEYWSEDEEGQSVYLGSDFNVPYTELVLKDITDFKNAEREHYNFRGWNVYLGQNWSMYPANKVYKTGLTDKDHETIEVYASWEIMDNHTITYNGNGGKGVPPEGEAFDKDPYTIADRIPTRDTYTFEGWCEDPDGNDHIYQPGEEISSVVENITLYAIWKQNPSVIYHANGGSFDNAPEKQYYPAGTEINVGKIGEELVTPSKAGYDFVGWHKTSSEATKGNAEYASDGSGKYTINKNEIFYAAWKKHTYTISATADKDSDFAKFKLVKDTDSYIDFKRTEDSEAVTYSAVKEDGLTEYKVENKDSVQIAVYVDEKYDSSQLTFYVNGLQTGCRNKKPGSDGTYFIYNIGNIQENIIIWIDGVYEKTYTVTYDTKGGNIVGDESSIVTEYVYKGKNLPKALPTTVNKDGYTFEYWTKAGSSDRKDSIDENDNGDVELVANWTPISYKVSFYNGDSKLDSICVTAIDYDEQLTIPGFPDDIAKPSEDAKFIGWGLEKTDKEADYIAGQKVRNLTTTANEEIVLYAIWDAPEYNVVYSAAGGTFVEGVDKVSMSYSDSKVAGSTVSIKAVDTEGNFEDTELKLVREGYEFAGFEYESGGPATGDTILKLEADVFVKATWTPKKHTVTFYGNCIAVDKAEWSAWEGADLENGPVTRTRTYGVTGEYTDDQISEVEPTELYDPLVAAGENISEEPTGFFKVTETQAGVATGGIVAEGASTYTCEFLLGWSVNSDATEPTYRPGEAITVSADTKLYAVWSSDTDSKFVSFNYNGGVSGISKGAVVPVPSEGLAISSVGEPTRAGYEFKGWATDKTADTPNADPTYTESTTLYAVWETEEIKVKYHSNNRYAGDSGNVSDWDYHAVITHVDDSITVEGGSIFTYAKDPRPSAEEKKEIDKTKFTHWVDSVSENGVARDGSRNYTKGGTISFPAKYVDNLAPKDGEGKRVLDLYACYENNTVSHYYIYDDNGGANGPGLVAVDEGDEYTVNVYPDPENEDEINVEEPPSRDGYKFLGWSETENSTTPDTGMELKAIDPKKYTVDSTTPMVNYLFAVWEKLEVKTVDYIDNTDPDNEKTIRTEKYYVDDTATVQFAKHPRKLGYEFVGWEDKNSGKKYYEEYKVGRDDGEASFDIQIADDIEFVPIWEVHKYIVEYRTGNDPEAYYKVNDIECDNDYRILDIADIVGKSDVVDVIKKSDSFKASTGYNFVGWSFTEGGTVDYRAGEEDILTTVDNQEITLYAVYEPLKTQFVLNDDNADRYREVAQTHNFTNLIPYDASMPNLSEAVEDEEIKVPTKYGYTFEGYFDSNNKKYYDEDLVTKVAFNKASDDLVELTAKWKAKKYEINYIYNGVNVASKDVSYGDTIKILRDKETSIEIKDGYVLVGWTLEKDTEAATEIYDQQASITIEYNEEKDKTPLYNDGRAVNLYAVVKPEDKVSLAYDANGGYRQPIDKNRYDIGNSVIVLDQEPLRVGYAFRGWSFDPNATVPDKIAGDTLAMQKDTILYAVWKENQYRLNYYVNGEIAKTDVLKYSESDYSFMDGSEYGTEENPFYGWSFIDNGPVSYISGQKLINPLASVDGVDVNLYAVYKFNVSDSGSGSSIITDEYIEKQLSKMENETGSLKEAIFSTLLLKAAAKKDSVSLKWERIANSEWYIVYGAKEGEVMQKIATLNSKKSSYAVKNLEKDKYYKFMVVGTMSLNGKQAVNSISPVIHVASKNSTVGNIKKLKCKKSIKLSVGGTVDANVTPVYTKKDVKKLVEPIRYESKNPSIATVDDNGKIVALAEGKTIIYAYSQHGDYVGIKVTVKNK